MGALVSRQAAKNAKFFTTLILRQAAKSARFSCSVVQCRAFSLAALRPGAGQAFQSGTVGFILHFILLIL